MHLVKKMLNIDKSKDDPNDSGHKVHKSNLSSLVPGEYKQLRAKRPTPTSHSAGRPGRYPADRIVKDNLRKKKAKEEFEIMKKYLEDFSQR